MNETNEQTNLCMHLLIESQAISHQIDIATNTEELRIIKIRIISLLQNTSQLKMYMTKTMISILLHDLQDCVRSIESLIWILTNFNFDINNLKDFEKNIINNYVHKFEKIFVSSIFVKNIFEESTDFEFLDENDYE